MGWGIGGRGELEELYGLENIEELEDLEDLETLGEREGGGDIEALGGMREGRWKGTKGGEGGEEIEKEIEIGGLGKFLYLCGVFLYVACFCRGGFGGVFYYFFGGECFGEGFYSFNT